MIHKSILLVLLLIFWGLHSSYSCTCRRTSLENHFDFSDVILKVKIISISDTTISDTLEARWLNLNENSNNQNFTLHKESNYLNKATVLGTYKGNLKFNDTISIFSGQGFGDCGFLFEIDKEYILFSKLRRLYKMNDGQPALYYNNFYLYTDICYGTAEYDSNCDKDLKRLRRDVHKK